MEGRIKTKGTTIVIGMDDTKHSKYAFQWYVNHLHRRGNYVVMVYAVELGFLNSTIKFNAPYAVSDSQTLQTLLEEEHKKISKILQGYLQLMDNSKVLGTAQTAHTEKPGEGILKVAEDVNADYIVVGCRSRGKLCRTFLGSVSDYVIHHSPIPVLLCPFREDSSK